MKSLENGISEVLSGPEILLLMDPTHNEESDWLSTFGWRHAWIWVPRSVVRWWRMSGMFRNMSSLSTWTWGKLQVNYFNCTSTNKLLKSNYTVVSHPVRELTLLSWNLVFGISVHISILSGCQQAKGKDHIPTSHVTAYSWRCERNPETRWISLDHANTVPSVH